MKIVKEKTFQGTWKGRAGSDITFHFDSNPTGKRVVAHTWKDDPTRTEVRAINGDAWRGTFFVEHSKQEMISPTRDDLRRVASELANQFFASRAA